MRLQAHDLLTGKEVCRIPPSRSGIHAITLLAGRGNQSGALAVSFESLIRVYSLADNSVMNELFLDQAEDATAISSAEVDGRKLVVYGNKIGQVRTWDPFNEGTDHGNDDADERRYVTALRPTVSNKRPAVLAAESANLVSSSVIMPQGTSPSTGYLHLYDADSGQEVRDWSLRLDGISGITTFAVTKDAELAMGGLMSDAIHLFALKTHKERSLPMPAGGSVDSLAYAKIDGRDVFFAGSMGAGGTIFQLDAHTGDILNTYQTADGSWPLKIHVLPEDHLLLYVEWNASEVSFLDLRGNYEGTLKANPGHSSSLTAFAPFMLDGDPILISGDQEGTVRFSNTSTGDVWGSIHLGATITDIEIVHGSIGISTTSGIAILNLHPSRIAQL